MRVSCGEDGVVEAGGRLELVLKNSSRRCYHNASQARSKSRARRAARELRRLNAKGLRREQGRAGEKLCSVVKLPHSSQKTA